MDLKAGRRRIREGVFFWRQPDGTWLASSGGSDGLIQLRRHHETYAQQVERLEANFDRIDDASSTFALLRAIAPLHRATMNGHAAMQQAREMFSDDADLISLRDLAGETDLAAELLHADARHALDFAVARESESQTRAGHQLMQAGNRLSLIAAIFLPLTALAAAFGMNLTHGLEGSPPAFFWLILAAGMVIGVILHAILSRTNLAASADRRDQDLHTRDLQRTRPGRDRLVRHDRAHTPRGRA